MRQKSSKEIIAIWVLKNMLKYIKTDFWVPHKTKNTMHHSKTNAKLKKKRTFLEAGRKHVPQII